MGACCSNQHNTEVNYVHTDEEAINTEVNCVCTGGKVKKINEHGGYKPVALINDISVEIDTLVKEIGNGAFSGCKKLKSITIP
eukprot:7621799-Ditylum_brightwellii.AAC.1